MTGWGTKLKNVIGDFATGVSGMDGGIGMVGRGLTAQMDRRNQRQTYEEALGQFMNGNTSGAYQTIADNGYGKEAFSYAMADQQRQEESDLRKELALLKDNRTSDVKNFEYLLTNGYSPEQARAIAFGSNTEAVGNALVSGDLSKPLGQSGSTEYDKRMGKALAEEEIKRKEQIRLQTQNIDRIEDLKNDIKKNPDAVSWAAPILTPVARLLGDKDYLASRGSILRKLGMIQNDLIAEAKSHGQSGINTIAEIEQATKGLNENSSEAELLAALEAMQASMNKLRRDNMQEGLVEQTPVIRIPTDEDAWGGI